MAGAALVCSVACASRTTEWLLSHIDTKYFAAAWRDALVQCCAQGNLSAAVMLCRNRQLCIASRAFARNALALCCEGGFLSMADWLAAACDLANVEDGQLALRRSCAHGQLRAAQWVADRFHMQDCPLFGGVLADCCEGGHLATSQWLVERFSVATERLSASEVGRALEAACRHSGHLFVTQWLASRLPLTRAAVVDCGALVSCCACGDLPAAMWLVAQFGLTDDDARARNNAALVRCCEGGHLPLAQWLVENFALTADDARAQRNAALRSACRAGRDVEVRWLVERFRLGVADVTGLLGPLAMCCSGGHTGLAQWLASSLQVTPADFAPGHCRFIFAACCRAGHLDAARWLLAQGMTTADDINAHRTRLPLMVMPLASLRWLAAEFGFSGEDAHAAMVLRRACARGELKLCAWLADEIGVSAVDVRADGCSALRAACESGRLSLVRWLVVRFALDEEDTCSGQPNAFWTSCAHGHLKTAKWLLSRFPGAVGDAARSLQMCAPRPGALASDGATVQWLVARLGLRAADLAVPHADWKAVDSARGTWLVTCLSSSRHFVLARWLADEALHLTRDNAAGSALAALCTACSAADAEMAAWLVQRFDLTAEDAWRDCCCVLHYCVKSGERDMVAWAVNSFNFTADELCCQLTCAPPNMSLGRWMIAHYHITEQNANGYLPALHVLRVLTKNDECP
eukprot:TRINITY_DN6443_c0_g1_i2.p1 TRINITY_DN6443_c0_g1~~TRINITY_DN6443_c0_g1_i2.p1  ORF type:complete len:760 (-),score=111.65 TRINITY_DN6443_c0_g1_i2:814-2886(-)